MYIHCIRHGSRYNPDTRLEGDLSVSRYNVLYNVSTPGSDTKDTYSPLALARLSRLFFRKLGCLSKRRKFRRKLGSHNESFTRSTRKLKPHIAHSRIFSNISKPEAMGRWKRDRRDRQTAGTHIEPHHCVPAVLAGDRGRDFLSH